MSSQQREVDATGERVSWVGSAAAKVIARVASALAREPQLDIAIATVLDEAATTLGAKAAHVYLSDRPEQPTRLRLVGDRRLPDDLRHRAATVSLDSTLLAARAARTRRIEHADEPCSRDEPSLRLAHEILCRVGARSILSIPLVAHGRLMGVLTCALGRAPSSAELGFVEAIAEVFALGLANASMMERAQHHRARFEALRDASLAMASSDDTAAVLGLIVGRARDIAGARVAALGILPSDDSSTFEPFVYSGVGQEQAVIVGRHPRPVGVLGAVVHGPIRLRDITRDTRFGGLPPGHPPITSFLGIPLISGERCVGILYLGDKVDAAEFDEHDQRIIEVLGRHAAVTVERLHARQALERELAARRRAERAARAAERQLRGVFDHALEAMFVVDDDLVVIDANPSARALLGIAEIRGRRLTELVAGSEPPLDELRGRATTERRLGDELRVTRLDGEVRTVEISVVPSFMPGRHLSVARDITARVRAETEVRRWADAFAHAEWGVAIGDPASERLSTVNRAFAEMHGYSVDELEGKPIADVFAPYSRLDLPHRLRRAQDEGHCTWESEHLRKDGSTFPVLIDVTAVRDHDGAVRYRVANVQDLSERKRHEQERERLLQQIERERNWLRAVIDEAPIGVILAEGTDGARILANGRADALLGFRLVPEHGVAQLAGAVHSADGSPRPKQELMTARALRGEAAHDEALVRRPDGTEIPVIASAAPVHDDRGRIAGAVLVVEDITATKELERLRDEWTSMIAHDLRQPVSVIQLSASLLPQQREELEDREQQLLLRVMGAARRLDRMIRDLLDASRLQAKRLTLSRRPSTALAIVRRAVDEVAATTPGRPIEIDADAGLPTIDVDPDRVHQILSNLLSNAVKYGRAGTAIRVEARASGDEVSISVTNEGSGIAEADQAKLFTRFYRATSTSGRARGIGLGLHISNALVEAHGGRMEVESAPEGPTTFRFTVPIARPG